MNSTDAVATKTAKIAVIGAGMAGLTAAQRLIAAGVEVTLIDKSHAPGGRASTLERDGFYLNQGPHALYKGGAAFQILTDLNITPAGGSPAPKRSLAILNGEVLDLPVDAASVMSTKLLSIGEKMEWGMLMTNLGKVELSNLYDVPLTQWLDDTVKNERVKELFKGLTRLGTYCNNPDKISAAAAIRQLVLALQKGVLYLDHGWQSLVDAMLQLVRSQAQEKQNSLVEIYGADVTAVTFVTADAGQALNEQKVEITINGEKHSFDSVVLALPPKQVSKLLATATSLESSLVKDLTQTLENVLPSHAACLDVCLKKLTNPENTFAIGIDQPLYYSVHSNTANLAENDQAMIHLAVYLPEGAKGGDEQETQLLELLEILQPGWQEELVYKRYLPNMSASFGTATAAENGSNGQATVTLPGVPNVFVCGDWVGSDYLLLDAAMHSAVAAAEAALTTCGNTAAIKAEACV